MKFFGSLLVVFLLSIRLFSADAYLKNNIIYEGDIAVLVIHLTGKDIKLKRLEEVAGMPIMEHGGKASSKYINGEKIKDIYYEVMFYPKKSLSIPSLEFKVNGKIEKTKPVELRLKKNPNPSIYFQAFLNKDTSYENEIIRFSLQFKYKDKIKFQDIKFIQPDFPGFWLEGVSYSPPEIKGDFIIHQINYFLTPKTVGKLMIGQGTVEAEQDGSETLLTRRNHERSFTSQPLFVTIKPLPVKTNIVGDFTIETFIDKKVINGNEMAHLMVKIKGAGNFNDIEPFVLDLKNATVTTKDPKIDSFPDKETIRGTFMQEFFIGNAKKDLVIPPFKHTAYNLQTKIKKTIQTEPIKIHVNNPIVEVSKRGGKEEIKLQKEKGFHLYSLNIIIGFLLGVVSILLVQFIVKKKSSIKIFKPTNHKTLLQKLFAYKGTDDGVDALIQKLEDNLYKNQKVTISSKEIKNVMKYISSKEN
ncbi:BatD family protein [Sulfurospirillum arcachonense]|uniref:BatD family protein n=1 Tax=Sulfurospirillum arcachonense TaxID=57666 RepID=UPI0004683AB6|nr:BatD family protein [Sulfurospirillum arcachonense]